ncbi:MAG TPA: VWA domain-containing protein [Candidatus Eisenbacteria bacterium]|nr:VWA domain-containing protein [Candidatus Eisenbacteria bacterium]
MIKNFLFCAIVGVLLSSVANGQVLSIPTFGPNYTNALAGDAVETARMDFDVFTINGQNSGSTPFQTPSGSISQLDLTAPGKAVKEYTKGYQLLLKKDYQGAVEHLENATDIYPKFVAAHNALGNAYLKLNENEKARAEFSKAVELDDHMPNSYLNLGCSHLALKDFKGAEDAFKKASSLAPLDMQVQLGLAYAAYANKDYPAVIATAQDVHAHEHRGAAVIHFFAAGAYEGQSNFEGAQTQMRLLLKEDPKSAQADDFRKILIGLNEAERHRGLLKFNPVEKVNYSIGVPTGPSPEVAGRMAQVAFQDMEEREQIADADEDPDPVCHDCGTAVVENVNPEADVIAKKFSGAVIRSTVDEVSILFAATNHGKSVMNLSTSDISVHDNSQPPNAILNFRNESQLPLRLGLVIDTSNSVLERFKFEQAAAIKFLEKVVTNKDDLAFVVGVNNSVLLAQDFTGDLGLISHAVNELAPAGGTALWDAVNFASEKLVSRGEIQPVARVLVVISDGEDNSSRGTLKETISKALRNEVAIYTVSTRDETNDEETALLGDQALKKLSELTGGAEYRPGSVSHLNGSLTELQEVIRSRYLVSYKPAGFQRDGRYRAIDITAEKDGHKLRVYARRGYYAASQTSTTRTVVTQ